MQLQLDAGPEAIEAQVREKYESDLLELLGNLEKANKAVVVAKAAKEHNHSAVSRMKERSDAVIRAVRLSEAKTATLRVRHMSMQRELARATTSAKELVATERSAKSVAAQVRAKQSASQKAVDSLAPLISRLGSIQILLDIDEPVVLGDSSMEWVTSPIFVFDRDSKVIPFDFGRFRVTLSKTDSRLSATFLALDPASRSECSHPHVRNSGSPCLGNASNQLLIALNSGDITEAIIIANNYLTHYNMADPFLSLENWVHGTKWHAAQCECGIASTLVCNCNRCTHCDRTFVSSGGSLLDRPCGSCSSCCSDKHSPTQVLSRKIGTSDCAHVSSVTA